ncbi:hypothetical protein OROMI_008185 [Orobanche minor]
MLIIVLVLDARFKLKNVTHMYAEEGLDVDEVERRTNAIKDLLMALYDEREYESTTSSKNNCLRPLPKANVKGKGKSLAAVGSFLIDV